MISELRAGDVAFGLMELVSLVLLVLYTLRQTEPQLTEGECTQRRRPQVQMFASGNGLESTRLVNVYVKELTISSRGRAG